MTRPEQTTSSQQSPCTSQPTRTVDPTKFWYVGTLSEVAAEQGKVVKPWPADVPNPFLRGTSQEGQTASV